MNLRLGGPVFGDCSTPESWIEQLQEQDYRAAYCPLHIEALDSQIGEYADAAAKADVLIAEVGAWSNPLSSNPTVRMDAIRLCKGALHLADRIGACCCVNISGSRGTQWDGPHADNFTTETFDMIVEVVRDIIDSVEPTRTYYTLEPLPWAYPDSIENYVRLIDAIDREQFAVHLDPVNLITSPHLYLNNAAFLREAFAVLGPYIRSCHAKDIAFSPKLTVHLDEVRPGLGGLDYHTFLREICRLERPIPLMLEHLYSAEDYALAADHIRGVANEAGVVFESA
ncbi:MAG TPA: TIM barrel protein [Chthoniobacteraceae bacterium]|nr:TIM barrel protein [Chthoniobacteraceae bacterium]